MPVSKIVSLCVCPVVAAGITYQATKTATEKRVRAEVKREQVVKRKPVRRAAAPTPPPFAPCPPVVETFPRVSGYPLPTVVYLGSPGPAVIARPEPYPTPVPEPGTWGLFALGAAGLAAIRKRRKSL